MNTTPLFCFGSLMDWDVLRCVLDDNVDGLTMVDATFPGYRVVKLPHESYPLLVVDEQQTALGKLLYGLTQAHLDRVIFFEGEEYQITPCTVQRDGSPALAQFFNEGVMPEPQMTDWCFDSWAREHKQFLLRQSKVYMSYYGKMTAAEADYYWQTYCELEYEEPLSAVG